MDDHVLDVLHRNVEHPTVRKALSVRHVGGLLGFLSVSDVLDLLDATDGEIWLEITHHEATYVFPAQQGYYAWKSSISNEHIRYLLAGLEDTPGHANMRLVVPGKSILCGNDDESKTESLQNS